MAKDKKDPDGTADSKALVLPTEALEVQKCACGGDHSPDDMVKMLETLVKKLGGGKRAGAKRTKLGPGDTDPFDALSDSELMGVLERAGGELVYRKKTNALVMPIIVGSATVGVISVHKGEKLVAGMIDVMQAEAARHGMERIVGEITGPGTDAECDPISDPMDLHQPN